MRISDWSSDVCSSDLPTACVAEPLELPEPPAASQKSIDRAMEIITSAQNPVLFVGAGVQLSQATEELRLFAEALGIPIVSTSWGGRGVISDDHPLFAGVVGDRTSTSLTSSNYC